MRYTYKTTFHICIWSGNNKLSAFIELDGLFRKMQNWGPILGVKFETLDSNLGQLQFKQEPSCRYCLSHIRLSSIRAWLAWLLNNISSCDVIGHVTPHGPFPVSSPLEPSHSLTISEIGLYSMANVTQWLTWPKWPLNKGQGHSFWYQSISHIRFSISCQWYLCCIARISPTAKRMKMDPYSRQRQNCSPQCPLNIGLLSSDWCCWTFIR